MHIIHVNLSRGFRGGERQTINLMEGLQALGIRQTLICRQGMELEQRARRFDLRTVGIRHPLSGHFRVPQSTLIHVHEARGAYWAAVEHALRKTPYVITRRIPTPLSRSLITAAVYRHATALFGVSRHVSSRLAIQTQRNVATMLSCSSQFQVAADETAAIRCRLGGGPIVGHVGVLNDDHKGQSVLIAAFHSLVRKFPEARLVLIGNGPDRKEFERLSGGDRRIVFAGQQADPGPWISALDVFAFPSREEGLGSSVLDAMLAGVPVVASAAGGLPELIGADERGALVDSLEPDAWADAIVRMVTDSPLRSRVVTAARRFAKQNDVASMAQRYASYYRTLLACDRKDFGWLDSESNAQP
jgi:glycosyltransferase involved in cell wall biosynthesis